MHTYWHALVCLGVLNKRQRWAARLRRVHSCLLRGEKKQETETEKAREKTQVHGCAHPLATNRNRYGTL